MSKPVFKRRHLVDFPPFPQKDNFYSIYWLYCTPCQFRKGINSIRKDFASSYRVDPFFGGNKAILIELSPLKVYHIRLCFDVVFTGTCNMLVLDTRAAFS